MNKTIVLTVIFAIFLIGIVNANPILNPIGDKIVNEGQILKFNITNTPPDSGYTTYTISLDGVVNITVPGGYDYYPFLFTAPYELSNNTQNTVLLVTFVAADGNSSDTETFHLTIINVNRQPHITSTAVTTATVGTPYSYQVTASDEDGDPLTYSLVTKPNWMSINAQTGLITGTPDTGTTTTVVVRVRDNGGASEDQTFILNPTVNSGIQIKSSTITLGGSSQRRSIADDVIKTTTATFTVENTGSYPVTGITLESTAATSYNITFAGVTQPFTLAPGATQLISVSAIVPEDHDAVDSDLAAASLNIGNVNVRGTQNGQAVVDTKPMTLQAENMLKIKKVKITYEASSKEQTETLSNRDEVKEIIPGSHVKLDITVENRYPSSGDYDISIEDVNVNFIIDEHDSFDVDEETDISNINGGDEEIVTIEFDFDDTVDEYTYSGHIDVQGDDENGAKHGDTWDIDLTVERTNDNIVIRTLELGSASITCDRQTTLQVEIVNLGSNAQDEGAVEIKNGPLGISLRDTFELTDNWGEDDSMFDKTYYLNIPESALPGIYRIDVKSYINNDELQQWKTVELNLASCATATTTTTSTTQKTTTTTSTTESEWEQGTGTQIKPGTGTQTGTGVVATTVTTGKNTKTETGFMTSQTYVALLIVATVVLLVLVIYALTALAGKKR